MGYCVAVSTGSNLVCLRSYYRSSLPGCHNIKQLPKTWVKGGFKIKLTTFSIQFKDTASVRKILDMKS